MVDPGYALGVAVLIVFFAVWLFWPKNGIIALILKNKQNTQRVQIEDALKHFFDREYKNRRGTLESVSGALEIDRDHAVGLLDRLLKLDLLSTSQNSFTLTSEGRSYALRIIRMHRLWERYLADETGFSETDWHREAERREHTTTTEQADALARSTGYPIVDPHGDPIPTELGEIPPYQGMPLSDLAIGELARIRHLEDEPASIYAQLVAVGLHPDMQVRVLHKSQTRIQFVADGDEVILAPVVAANVTVSSAGQDEEIIGPYESLSVLQHGEAAEVIGISPVCRGIQRRRLMDLGVLPGTIISAELVAGSGNPKAYSIRGALIALRNDQADFIFVRRKETAS